MKKILILMFIFSAFILSSCLDSKSLSKSGELVTNDLIGFSETEYVICISKNIPDADKILKAVNDSISEIDMNDIAIKYSDYKNRRSFKTLENYMYNLNDNTGGDLRVMTVTLEPFNYSGAGGAYTDGIDAYIMLHVAENLNKKLITYDRVYSYSYNEVKNGHADIFTGGISLSNEIRNDFLVSEVYLTGKQQIISDANENFTDLSDLKGKVIGVVKGRDSEKIVSEAIANGLLKNSGATILACETDAEAESMLHTEMCDVLMIDYLSAMLIVAKANA